MMQNACEKQKPDFIVNMLMKLSTFQNNNESSLKRERVGTRCIQESRVPCPCNKCANLKVAK